MTKKIEYLFDDRIFNNKFSCDLDKCKGACCTVKGTLGAPIDETEILIIEKNKFLDYEATNFFGNEKELFEVLKLLNDGKLLCVENLASTYDTSTRSIRRDFELIKEVCGDVLISPQKGCYQAVQKFILNETLNAQKDDEKGYYVH